MKKSFRAASVLAALLTLNSFGVSTSHAGDCLLDSNDNGVANVIIDTDGGATSSTSILGNGLACGEGADASGARAVALGHDSMADGRAAIAIGEDSDALEDFTIAIGGDGLDSNSFGARATMKGAVAVGTDAEASGFDSIAIGRTSVAANSNAIAIGGDGTDPLTGGSLALGLGSVAIGADSAAIGDTSLALGAGARANNDNNIAIGSNSNAAFDNSIAIGSDVATTRQNQILIGDETQTYTLAGVGSAASSSAQGTPIGLVSSDADGNLAVNTSILTDVSTNTANISSNTNSINALQNSFGTFSDKIAGNTEGVAMAIAMGGAILPTAKNFALSGNLGFFEGNKALAVSGSARVNENFQVNMGIGIGLDQNTKGGRVGFTVAW